MESKRLILFIAIAVAILIAWDKIFPSQEIAPQKNQSSQVEKKINSPIIANNSAALDSNIANNNPANLITVQTDTLKATISTIGGDIKTLELLKYKDSLKQNNNYLALQDDSNRIITTQTGLVSNDANLNLLLPNHKSKFENEANEYKMLDHQNSIVVKLTYKNADLQVNKLITFYKNSYLINIEYEIINHSKDLNDVAAYWRLIRDQQTSNSDSKFVHTFTGAIAYNDSIKAHKIKFENIVKANGGAVEDIPNQTNNGWAGFVEHYFSTIWMLNTKEQVSICNNNIKCNFDFSYLPNSLVTAGFITQIPTIKSNTTYKINMSLFSGPDQYKIFKQIDPSLERIKDYGIFYIFATPLFWLLVHIFELVQNWGWSIILLTVLVKVVLYPLTATSFRSMAKLKALAPKLQLLKEKYSHDKVTMQKEIMHLYRHEKVNPVGGCLPMILQIPVFIGLYWALLCSVELRQSSFLWVHDLSKPDPFFILPILMGISMFIQTFFNPPSSDPVQAKVMKIMPLMFSVMFFFFPSGLVLYWIANNTLSITQQWYINRSLKKHK
jgi:YidC/Oxa1 family membrane protein insertase